MGKILKTDSYIFGNYTVKFPSGIVQRYELSVNQFSKWIPHQVVTPLPISSITGVAEACQKCLINVLPCRFSILIRKHTF